MFYYSLNYFSTFHDILKTELFLFDNNNRLFAQLHGIKYSYLILIIQIQSYDLKLTIPIKVNYSNNQTLA